MINHHDGERLKLIGDDETIDFMPLETYLTQWMYGDGRKIAIVKLIEAIFHGALKLSKRVAGGHLYGDPGRLVGSNSDGDLQKSIDVGSHYLFSELLLEAGAGKLLSEESEDIISNPDGGDFAVAFDPLDGSGNVGIGAPIGTFFSIFPNSISHDPFLVKGREQVAAGYISYGHSVDFALSVGDGLVLGAMDPESGVFYIIQENVTLAPDTADLAYNASVYRHLFEPMRQYVDDAQQGSEGPRGKNFNMRWLGAAVGELHRIFQRGGLFFYVNDKRKGYENGRLRLIYEAFPIAFLCEAAKGKATNGMQDILDIIADSHHGRTPLIFGAANEVDTIRSYHHSSLKSN